MTRLLTPDQFCEKLNTLFSSLKAKLQAALPASDIQHVGSSAIKGAISKGDLDILVRVDKTAMAEATTAIESLGFKIKSDTLRTDDLCMLTTDAFGEDVAIQLISKGSTFEDFLIFRDTLNENPALVITYNQLKTGSADLSDADYRTKKSAFITSVLKAFGSPSSE